jgi:hypothetical protein
VPDGAAAGLPEKLEMALALARALELQAAFSDAKARRALYDEGITLLRGVGVGAINTAASSSSSPSSPSSPSPSSSAHHGALGELLAKKAQTFSGKDKERIPLLDEALGLLSRESTEWWACKKLLASAHQDAYHPWQAEALWREVCVVTVPAFELAVLRAIHHSKCP